jgi:hypothetical protein
MTKYQEKEHFSDYWKNRERVCEIYEVDPATTHMHHIVDRWTVLHDPVFEEFDLNEKSNLYPFTDDERGERLHVTKQDHKDLHNEIGRRQYEKRKEEETLGW